MSSNKPDDELHPLAVEQEDILRLLNELGLVREPERPRTHDEFKFKTQPVPRLDEFPSEHGAIDELKTVADVRTEPYAMPAGLSWCEVDLKDDEQAQELHDLLAANYAEDDDSTQRLYYSVDFLRWMLMPPGYHVHWHVGVRNTRTGKLMAFISSIPVTMRVYTNEMPMAEINFLCVHKKLRAKRLAPVLIKEITRRANLCGVWQAIYTAGTVLPMPVSQCRYYHRSLNPKKLVETGFSALPPRMTM